MGTRLNGSRGVIFMPKRELTPNQKLFCEEYAIDRNGSRAYKAVYKGVTKDKTAEQCASRLLSSNAKVKAYVDKLLAKLAFKAEVTAERVLKEEACLAYSDIGEIFDGETLIPVNQIPEDIRRAISSVKVNTKTFKGETETTYEYRFWDKGAALKRLEKHLGMYEDKTEVDNSVKVLIINYGEAGQKTVKQGIPPAVS